MQEHPKLEALSVKRLAAKEESRRRDIQVSCTDNREVVLLREVIDFPKCAAGPNMDNVVVTHRHRLDVAYVDDDPGLVNAIEARIRVMSARANGEFRSSLPYNL